MHINPGNVGNRANELVNQLKVFHLSFTIICFFVLFCKSIFNNSFRVVHVHIKQGIYQCRSEMTLNSKTLACNFLIWTKSSKKLMDEKILASKFSIFPLHFIFSLTCVTYNRYGTVSDYFDAVNAASKKNNIQFPSYNGDFFPYADNDDSYWTVRLL